MTGIVSSFSTIWRLAAPYFYSEDRWPGRILLAAVIAVELSLVGITVLLTYWQNSFYNALQGRDWDVFVSQLIYFCFLATCATILQVYKLYLNQWLQIRWRRWMTREYLNNWLTDSTHYRMQLLGETADNPDQRIAEDIRMFIERTLTIGAGLMSAIVTLLSFIVILWTLSNAAPFELFGFNITAIPGYLVWAALIYAIAGTAFTHWIGWPLVPLNFNQQRFEADFRFNLIRVIENSEQIAMLGGEKTESNRLYSRFSKVVSNWHEIMSRQKKLTFFTTGYTQVSIVFPIIVVSPAYFSGVIQLGGLVQTSSAFNSVQNSLSFFITIYKDFAEWRAVIARLDGFEHSIAVARATNTSQSRVDIETHETQTGLSIEGLSVRLPSGAPLVTSDNIVIESGQHALVSGPSGGGKSTFFRAIAGLWPFATGKIVVPKGAKLMILPQRPYFPVASLEEAVIYPAESGQFKCEQIAEVLIAVGLPALSTRLEDEAHWNRILSLGEQQRLGIARAILHRPDYLFLDEASASLDEPAEARVYRLLHERLPDTTIISIGHRSTLKVFHHRHLTLHTDGEKKRIGEAAAEPGLMAQPAAS
ncbi:MAG: ABC transporter ATP-binding protein/permease [Xanthobacteraceae bacterium]